MLFDWRTLDFPASPRLTRPAQALCTRWLLYSLHLFVFDEVVVVVVVVVVVLVVVVVVVVVDVVVASAVVCLFWMLWLYWS